MNKKTKRITVGLVAVLCFLLVFALGFGLTGAYYKATRTATGTVELDQGIVLNYSGFSEDADLQVWNKGVELKLFETNPDHGVPAATINVADAAIAKGTAAKGTVIDFVVRAKLEYTYYLYTTEATRNLESTAVAAEDYAAVHAATVATPIAFTADWKMGTDGYAYYTEGEANTLAYLPATEVNLFSNDLVLVNWTSEFGGPLVEIDDVQREVGRIVVTLTVEAVQPEAVTAEGWEIKTLPAA